jgi:peptidoglycan/LPS O-acetylase OafA/YrhL
MSGNHLSTGPVFSTLANADAAVQTFMILSGFVIALVIDRRHENYTDYLTRRLFRIYPVFFLVCCAGIALHIVFGQLIHQWWPAFFQPEMLREFATTWEATNSNIPAYAAAVLTMTNGIIPSGLLPHAAVAFIGVAWSLSLEFQFYLLAPFICRSLNFGNGERRLRHLVLLIVLLVTFRQMFLSRIGDFGLSNFAAFFPFSIEFFVIGILSYHLFQWCLKRRETLITLSGDNRFSLLIWMILIFLLVVADRNRLILKGQILDVTGHHWTAIVIWALTLGWLIDRELGITTRLHDIGNFFFHSEFAMFLGKISYSVYLWHIPIIIIVQWSLFHRGLARTWQECLFQSSLISVPLIILVSWISYRWIEQPFIKIGSQFIEKRSIFK